MEIGLLFHYKFLPTTLATNMLQLSPSKMKIVYYHNKGMCQKKNYTSKIQKYQVDPYLYDFSVLKDPSNCILFQQITKCLSPILTKSHSQSTSHLHSHTIINNFCYICLSMTTDIDIPEIS